MGIDKCNHSDEHFAAGLLDDYLRGAAKGPASCRINKSDPPDLTVTWEDGERWGVEVTRTYQQVELIGKEGASDSAVAVSTTLCAFALKLGEATEGIRKRDYQLYLEAPGPFSTWKASTPLSPWKKEAESLIQEHIKSGKSEVLRFPGGSLTPQDHGTCWRYMVGLPAAELSSASFEMIRRAFTQKAEDLRRWSNGYDECLLLLLNCYPLAEAFDVKAALETLVANSERECRFDRVLWWETRGSSLVQMVP